MAVQYVDARVRNRTTDGDGARCRGRWDHLIGRNANSSLRWSIFVYEPRSRRPLTPGLHLMSSQHFASDNEGGRCLVDN